MDTVIHVVIGVLNCSHLKQDHGKLGPGNSRITMR